MRKHLLFALIGVLLVACGGQRDVVQEGRFQKRVHQRGWHVDLHGKQAPHETRAMIRSMAVRHSNSVATIPTPEGRLIASTSTPFVSIPSEGTDLPLRSSHSARPSRWSEEVQPLSTEPGGDDKAPERINRLAIPALVMSLVAVGLGFGSNPLLLIAAILTSLLLAGIAAGQIRTKKQRGKGFVMAALVIGSIAALLTIISMVRYGVDP